MTVRSDITNPFYGKPYEETYKVMNEPIYGVQEEWIKWLMRNVPKDGLVIDMGCGSGYGTNIIRRLGYNVIGVDISSSGINIAKTYFPATTYAVADLTKDDIWEKLKPDYAVSNAFFMYGLSGTEFPSDRIKKATDYANHIFKYVKLEHAMNITGWHIDRRKYSDKHIFNYGPSYQPFFNALRSAGYDIWSMTWDEGIIWTVRK